MYFHEGFRHQQGLGLGSLFGSLFRSLMPIAKMGLSAGKNFLKSNVCAVCFSFLMKSFYFVFYLKRLVVYPEDDRIFYIVEENFILTRYLLYLNKNKMKFKLFRNLEQLCN